jgi:hypothetical protein
MQRFPATLKGLARGARPDPLLQLFDRVGKAAGITRLTSDRIERGSR